MWKENIQSTTPRMRTLGLVNRHRHTKDTNSPARNNSPDQDHRQILRSALQNGPDHGNEPADLDRASTAETVDCQTGRECSNAC